MGITEGTLQDLTTEGVELFQQANYKGAEAAFVECVALVRTKPEVPIKLADALNNLSIACFSLSKYSAAEEALREALALTSDSQNSESPEWKIMRACLLNNHARVLGEFERFDESEAALFEAIELVTPYHPAYAAEFNSNLLRTYTVLPMWRKKAQFRAEEFDRLIALGEALEVFHDELGGWKRPGKAWDVAGSPSPESLQARSALNKITYRYVSRDDAKADYKLILKLDEDSKQISPILMQYVCLSLAEIAIHEGDMALAQRMLDDATRITGSTYLRSHASNYLALLRAATYCLMMGSLDKAAKIMDSAENLVRESLGEENLHYMRCLSAKALVAPILFGLNESNKQLSDLYKCRDLAKKFFPDTHSTVIDMNLSVVNLCIQANKLAEAESLLTETSENADKSFNKLSRQSRCLSLFAELRQKQGRAKEAEDFLRALELMLAQEDYLTNEEKIKQLDYIGKMYMDAGLFADGERIFREGVVVAAPLSAKLRQTARQHLALCLMRVGKNADASDVLGSVGETNSGDSKAITRREELMTQSQLAWSLQAKKRFAQAKALATEVVNEAHLLMPDCEESLVIALSVLMEQAKSANMPDEMLRLLSLLSGYNESLRLRSTMPMLYLEVAQAYAKQKSIKAEQLFEKAIQAAELVQSFTPHCLDAAVLAYLNYCASIRKNERALQLVDRLIILRSATSGVQSLDYAVALTAKARLLAEFDPGGAEPISLESLNLLEGMTDPMTKIQLLVAVSVRENLLKKLMRFDEAAKMNARSLELRTELDSQLAALKATRELNK